MLQFAISVPGFLISNPKWRTAVEQSFLNHIEYDASSCSSTDARATEFRILKDMSSKKHLKIVSIHLPWGWAYDSSDELIRKKAASNLLECLKSFEELNVRNYTIHCTNREPIPDDSRQFAISAIRKTISELLPTLQAQNASANLEILPRTCIGRTPDELLAVMKDFPQENLGICFDVNHLCGCPEKLPELIRSVSHQIRTFHISDYDGIDECHWYPGIGVIDWPSVMNEIRQIQHPTHLIFECGGFVKTPEWQNRPLNPAILQKNAEDIVFFLENATELQRMKSDFFLTQTAKSKF